MEMNWRDWDRQPGDRLTIIMELFRHGGGAQILTSGFGVEKKQVRKIVERIWLLGYGGSEWRTGDKDNEYPCFRCGNWVDGAEWGWGRGLAGRRGEALYAAGCVRLRRFGLEMRLASVSSWTQEWLEWPGECLNRERRRALDRALKNRCLVFDLQPSVSGLFGNPQRRKKSRLTTYLFSRNPPKFFDLWKENGPQMIFPTHLSQ